MLRTKFTNIFRSFLISYMIILLIPNVAGYFSYRAAIAAAEAGSIETSMMMLNRSKDLFERRMTEVESFATNIAMNQDLSILLSDKVNERG